MYNSKQLILQLQSQGIECSEFKDHVGANSKIFKFKINDEIKILKVYKGNSERKKISRDREIRSIKFLRENGFDKIPELDDLLLVSDGVCLKFIKGKNPKQNLITHHKIFTAMLELKKIFKINPNFDAAIDSCKDAEQLLNQIDSRIKLLVYLPKEFKVKLEKTLTNLKKRTPFEFAQELDTYSFSDFGAHNVINYRNKFTYLDFEYFGKDTGLKMLVDYTLHPKNRINQFILNKIIDVGKRHFEIEKGKFLNSIKFMSLKWATIVAKKFEIEESKNTREMFLWYLNLSSIRNQTDIYDFLCFRDKVLQ